MAKLFRPGGSLDGLDFNSMIDELQKRYGNLCKLPGLFGKSDLVFVFEPKDMETIYRTEGQYPMRQGFDSMIYYRTHWRKDVYKNTIGLLG